MTLYELKSEWEELHRQIESGEIPEEAIADTLEAMELDINDKAEQIAIMCKNDKAMADAIDEEIKALKARKDAIENRCDRFKTYLSETMQAMGLDKVETAKAKVSFRTSKSLNIEDEAAFMLLYPEFVVTKETISKQLATDFIKAGNELRWAELVEKKNIQIK